VAAPHHLVRLPRQPPLGPPPWFEQKEMGRKKKKGRWLLAGGRSTPCAGESRRLRRHWTGPGEDRMEARVSESSTGGRSGFDPAKSTESRRIRSDGQDRPREAGDGAGQIRPRWEGSFPAQAHAVAWDAGALRQNGPRAGFAAGPPVFNLHSKVCQLFYSFSEAFPIVLILYSNLNQRNNLS